LALNLDIDVIRRSLDEWPSDPATAGLRARDLTLSAARTHLGSGHDVVVPQFLGRVEFIEQLEATAREVGAAFCEIVLLDSLDNVLRRFTDRGRTSSDPAHAEAAEMLGGMDELAAMYQRLLSIVAVRPSIQVVMSEEGQVDEAYRAFVACVRSC
jgi:hypothetical protein